MPTCLDNPIVQKEALTFLRLLRQAAHQNASNRLERYLLTTAGRVRVAVQPLAEPLVESHWMIAYRDREWDWTQYEGGLLEDVAAWLVCRLVEIGALTRDAASLFTQEERERLQRTAVLEAASNSEARAWYHLYYDRS